MYYLFGSLGPFSPSRCRSSGFFAQASSFVCEKRGLYFAAAMADATFAAWQQSEIFLAFDYWIGQSLQDATSIERSCHGTKPGLYGPWIEIHKNNLKHRLASQKNKLQRTTTRRTDDHECWYSNIKRYSMTTALWYLLPLGAVSLHARVARDAGLQRMGLCIPQVGIPLSGGPRTS